MRGVFNGVIQKVLKVLATRDSMPRLDAQRGTLIPATPKEGEGMRALAWSLSGVGLGFWAVLLVFDIAGDLQPLQSLALEGVICCALAAPLFFITDHRRKRRPKPL
jgi:hypothetical protein